MGRGCILSMILNNYNMVLSKRLSIFLGIATLILLIPLIAMQFTSQVNWELSDFIIASILLYGTAILINLIITTSKKHKIILIVTILVLLLVIWMEMAVGLFGSPFAGS